MLPGYFSDSREGPTSHGALHTNPGEEALLWQSFSLDLRSAGRLCGTGAARDNHLVLIMDITMH